MKSYITEFLITTVLIILITHAQSVAQTPWVPDPLFGSNGTTRVNFGTAHHDYPNDMLLLPNNKILVGGITTSSTEGYFVSMTQLMGNGQVDTSNFGIDGKVLVHFVVRDHANDIELQEDGKILAVGSEAINNGVSYITPSLYRFNSDGTVDTTFGDGGKAIHRFTGNSAGELYGIKVLEDGRILVTGVSTMNHGFGAMRFLPNGQLDSNFGVGGIAIINYSLGSHSVGSLFLADTAVIMATVDISPTNIVLAMMDSSGNPNTNFGNNGIVETGIVGNFSGRESLALTSDGKILLGCTTPNSSPTNFTVIRFLVDGSVDSTFGTNGRTDIQFGSENVLYDMKLDGNGQILLVGDAGGQAGLIRLNDDGSPDTNFAPDGKFSLDLSIGNGSNYLRTCLPLSNGDILAAGYDPTSNSGDYVVVKLTQNLTNVDETIINHPNEFVLNQNYPNPFNPLTTIQYSIPQRSTVVLKVYDILGKEVATLVNEEQQPGFYEVDFSANGLASGMYLYRLQAGSFIETKKMILIK